MFPSSPPAAATKATFTDPQIQRAMRVVLSGERIRSGAVWGFGVSMATPTDDGV